MSLSPFADLDTGGYVARKLKRILKKFELEYLLNEGHILDLGCGIGTVTTPMQREFPYTSIIGIDVGEESLQKSKRLSEGCLQLVRGNVRELPFMNDSISVVYSRFIYDFNNEEPYAEKIAKELLRILRPGGIYHIQEWGIDMYKIPSILIGLGMKILDEDEHKTHMTLRKNPI